MGAGTLFLVSTPIGNLEDVTLRALRVLRETPHLYAEDTRRTRALLDRHGIRARVRSLHAHNEAARVGEVLALLARGEDVAVVSDAGTPLLSDPGERLVEAAGASGCRVSPIPGPSATLAALVASGLPVLPFLCIGFPPRRAGRRRTLFAELAVRAETLVIFESPRRVAETLAELADGLGPERRACVARELTKVHESVERGTLAELAARLAEGVRGEVTLVVAGRSAKQEVVSEQSVEAALARLLAAGRSPREASREVAEVLGVPRRSAYALAVALRARGKP
jgi:16S rRNA (cytidine1402-2'-O)-methyltransferase